MKVMNVYYTKHVADNLGISTSTLRKWSLLLEHEDGGNYQFERNDKNERMFFDYDILALRHLMKLTQEDGVTLQNAVKSVGSSARSRREISGDVAISLKQDRTNHDNKLDQLLMIVESQGEQLDKLERFNRELLGKLDDQNKNIGEFVTKTDQQIMNLKSDTLERRQRIAIAMDKKEDKQKGLMAKLFGPY
jgi:DNA-binding transcriptional MerR regulator